MGGKGGNKGIPSSYYGTMSNIAQGELGLAQDANTRASQEFNLTYPGLEKAEGYYTQLSTGDPAALARANAPAIQQINQQAESAKKRIAEDSPRGGAKNLALEEGQISKGAQISDLTTKSYLSSFGSLAGLAGQGAQTSLGESGQSLAGLTSAGNTETQTANIGEEQKGNTLGFVGSLAGAGASLAAMCWIAVSLFGENAYETCVLRTYFNDMLDHHWFGKYVCKLYRRFGPAVAGRIEKSSTWRAVFGFIYINLYYHAKRVMPEEMKTKAFDSYWESRKTGAVI